jgi:Rrf2 family protein
MIFSKKCEYGLQTALLLSTLPYGDTLSTGEISSVLTIPKDFTGKILQELVSARLVDSRRGNGGGFGLLLPASKIKLLDIINALDGLDIFNFCVLGFKRCNPDNPCPVHHEWDGLRQMVYELFATTSLEDIKDKSIKKIENLFHDELKLKMEVAAQMNNSKLSA